MTSLDLRPLTIGELFDRAFVLYRRHFRLFVGITALPGVFALLLTVLQQVFTSVSTPVESGGEKDAAAAVENLVTGLALFGGVMVAAILYYVVYMIALGATTFAVSEIYVGRPVTIAESYQRMRGRIGALIILLLLVGIRYAGLGILFVFVTGTTAAVAALGIPLLAGLVMVFGALLCLGLFLFLTLRYGLCIPALVLEALGPGDSIRRSIELTRGRLGRVFLMVVCATMVTWAAFVLFQGPFLAAAMMAGLETSRGFWLNLAGGVLGTIGTTLTAPFMVIGLALIYYDARIREEGFDLELSLAALDAR